MACFRFFVIVFLIFFTCQSVQAGNRYSDEYAWKDVCPGGGYFYPGDHQDEDLYWIEYRGLYQCNCTSYVADMVNDVLDRNGYNEVFNNWYLQPGKKKWSDAYLWAKAAKRAGIDISKYCYPGAVAWWDRNDPKNKNDKGHVAFVQRVNFNNSYEITGIDVSEYNIKKEDYSERSISINDKNNYPDAFIHVIPKAIDDWSLYQDMVQMWTISGKPFSNQGSDGISCKVLGWSDSNNDTSIYLINPEAKTPDADIHITHHHIRPYKKGSWHERVDVDLGPGESFAFHTQARVGNRSGYYLKEVDIDYCVTTTKNFDISHDDRKRLDDDKVDIDAGKKENATLRRSKAKVSDDFSSIIIRTDDRKSFSFPITTEDLAKGRKTFYFYIDVETKDKSDRDVSSEAKSDEYGKLVINLLSNTPKFSVSKTKGPAPLKVKFKNQSKGDVFSYEWDFGDGFGSSSTNPSHTFKKTGKFNVSLTVTDTQGDSRTSKKVIEVYNPIPYVKIFEPKAGVEWKSNKDRWIKFHKYNLLKGHPIQVQYSCNSGSKWVTCHKGNIKIKGKVTRFKWKMDKKGTKDMKKSKALVRVIDRKTGKELGRSALFKTNRASGDPKWK